LNLFTRLYRDAQSTQHKIDRHILSYPEELNERISAMFGNVLETWRVGTKLIMELNLYFDSY